MSLEPGQMLADYRLVEKIGEGGMGVVWKAADPDRLTRFGREARLLASLNHPGIATIHGLHQSRNRLEPSIGPCYAVRKLPPQTRSDSRGETMSVNPPGSPAKIQTLVHSDGLLQLVVAGSCF